MNKIYLNESNTNLMQVINFNDKIWKWNCGGDSYKIDWTKLDLNDETVLNYKFFLKYRLDKLSLYSVSKGEIYFIRDISKKLGNFPFLMKDINIYLSNINEKRNLYSFKKLYEFCLINDFEGFSDEIFIKIKEYKIKPNIPYEKVFLSQLYFEETDKKKLLDKLYQPEKFANYNLLISNVILHLAYELAPRPSQFYLLNIEDFKYLNKNNSDTVYSSLNLPMSKKRNSKNIEKRQRSISKELANKIKLMLSLREDNFNNDSPLFSFKDNERLSITIFTKIIIEELKKLDIKNKSATDLRHNLAQSLADQGASAEIIAEILGHNSTLPARAYITATPKIADIKSKALGKNEKYSSLIKMMTTGKIIDKNEAPTFSYVKGMVNGQYIGGIGSCGLDINTNCPKNPVYSCYTCIKFHPFIDGNHNHVVENLEKQTQYFIDISEKSNDIEYNRPLVQLNETILAVKSVINKINDSNE